ncbi:hypothetical protein C2845_PM10G12200 [Panicum miliaceum]|uniref:J domain-containing protein n=1 Tax=Panicum miliaceum TaxID=4540 RepID=A0A3L6PD67_PANMI|nr:hypothetical protein C2845_PM10G12200 [Panicum miliaceum]
MLGFFGTSADSDLCHLQLGNGSVHHELIRPNNYRQRSVIRCCSTARGRTKDYYYQVLGVTVYSTPQEIKEAYRKLQKQHHPDIAGYKGHDYTLLLNEAYKVLMRSLSRHADGKSRAGPLWKWSHWDGYSSWNGPVRSQALFVDENKCIGQLAVESCPVNCIHWVDSQELPMLGFLSRPQPKAMASSVVGGNGPRTCSQQPRTLPRDSKGWSRNLNGSNPPEATVGIQTAKLKQRRRLRRGLVDVWNVLRRWRKGGTDQ